MSGDVRESIEVNRAKQQAWKHWARRVIVVMVVLVVLSELLARLVGLGDPPLVMADPEIEYLFRPSASYSVLGRRVRYNAYSMRSDDFPARKADENELRVMVLGDSVVNGSVAVDQSELATSRLQEQLGQAISQAVIVGNISAGSWGPANLLAYVRRFGLFDADVIILVLNSDDASDIPSLDPAAGVLSYPDRKPISALVYSFRRYVPKVVEMLVWYTFPSGPGSSASEDESTRQKEFPAIPALRELLEVAIDTGATVIVVFYPISEELHNDHNPGDDAIRQAASNKPIRVLDLWPPFEEAVSHGEDLYRDGIHPNARGHRIIADQLEGAVVEALRDKNHAQPIVK